MATTKTENYTAEMTTELVDAYKENPTAETVALFAEKFGKTVKSIVAKLSREGAYVKQAYVSKNGAKVEKKNTTADAIGNILKMTEAEIDSLTKANRSALQKVFNALTNSVSFDSANQMATDSYNEGFNAGLNQRNF